MQFALLSGEKALATKGARGVCPNCDEPVLAKCGTIRVAHWAHLGNLDCDPWAEGETEWHRSWKNLFPKEHVEVCMVGHRADIYTRGRFVIELQNSPISSAEIAEREKAYGKMVWVVNAAKFIDRLFLMERYEETDKFKFRWLKKRPTWLAAKRPVFLDLGQNRVDQILGEVKFKGGDPSLFPPSRRFARPEEPPIVHGELAGHTILLIKTLYNNGWGSVQAVSKEALVTRWLG